MILLANSLAKAGLTLLPLLYSPPEYWDYRHAPPCLAKDTLQTQNLLQYYVL